jgi:hypothetical protein
MGFLSLTEYKWNEDLDKDDMSLIFPHINEPIVIRDYCKNTIAYKKWRPENMSKIFGNKRFKVDTYSKKTTGHWTNHGHTMTMEEYFNYMKSVDKPQHFIGELSLGGSGCDQIDTDLYTKLYRDLDNRQNYKNNQTYDKTVMYYGKNSCTECHIHFVDNYIVNQIFGTKTFYFFDYNDNNDIVNKKSIWDVDGPHDGGPGYITYNNDDGSISKTFLDLNLNNFNKLYKVTLNPGDSVLIPPWWWHTTQGHDINCTIVNGFKRKDLAYLFRMPDLLFNTYYLFGISIFLDNIIETLILITIILILFSNIYKIFPYTFFKEFPIFFIIIWPIIPILLSQVN